MSATQNPPSLSFDKHTNTLSCAGTWNVSTIATILKHPLRISSPANKIHINGSDISHMDTTGAWALHQQARTLTASGKAPVFSGFNEEHSALLEIVEAALPPLSKPSKKRAKSSKPSIFYRVGEMTFQQFASLTKLLSFFGEVVVSLIQIVKRPAQLPYKSFLNTIEETGYRALPIVGLLCFLIGVVLAYQSGQQLKTYGANIYIISLVGVGILQEFGPMITAIIVAGRTSSSFTAQIGSMQLNEEIDAMRTMGLSPIVRLVIPKAFGLIIALPLLIVWADIFGVLGGMVVAEKQLGISYYNFLLNFPHMIELRTFLNGLLKGPFFAIIIASVGCYEGFQVASSADSVGKHTTRSVVYSIFLIITTDALFSVLLPWQSI